MARRTIETESARWLHMSDKALRAAAHLLTAGDYEFSAHSSHQAAELALKVLWIVVKRGPPRKTHDLPALGTALQAPARLGPALRSLDAAYIDSRYPSAAEEAGFDNPRTARHLLAHAQEVIAWTKEQHHKLLGASSGKYGRASRPRP